MTRRRVDVLGSPIDVVDLDGAVSQLLAWGMQRQGRSICACNVHSVVEARHDPQLAAAIASADLVIADGAPIAWLMRRAGCAKQRRVSGPDLMWAYLPAAAAQGHRVFLYGSTTETLARLTARTQECFPGLVIAGTHAPPFRLENELEDRQIVDRINASDAASVWVALGCPKQEAWIASHRNRIHSVMVGVGAAFDFHAGIVQRAPGWMQAVGLEWLHRLLAEPRRLWRRYLFTNTLFVVEVLRHIVER